MLEISPTSTSGYISSVGHPEWYQRKSTLHSLLHNSLPYQKRGGHEITISTKQLPCSDQAHITRIECPKRWQPKDPADFEQITRVSGDGLIQEGISCTRCNRRKSEVPSGEGLTWPGFGCCGLPCKWRRDGSMVQDFNYITCSSDTMA